MSILSLADESVQFLLCSHGSCLALAFRGDSLAIQRCFNWACNTGVSRGELLWIYLGGQSIAYIFVKDRATIIAGLAAQFYAEIILNKEIPPLVDRRNEESDEIELEYNEEKINSLANFRAQEFFDKRIEFDNFLDRIPLEDAVVYDLPMDGGEKLASQFEPS